MTKEQIAGIPALLKATSEAIKPLQKFVADLAQHDLSDSVRLAKHVLAMQDALREMRDEFVDLALLTETEINAHDLEQL